MKIKDLFEMTAVYRNELPEPYRSMKVIGKGMTSLVLDAGNDVIMLTRDLIKKDWLGGTVGNDEIAQWIDTLPGKAFFNRKLGDRDIYVLRMPKLFKLSTENARKIREESKRYETLPAEEVKKYIIGTNQTSESIRSAKHAAFRDLYPDSILLPLLDFLENYGARDYSWDLSVRNAMQDAQGNIILTDPIVDSDLMKVMRQR